MNSKAKEKLIELLKILSLDEEKANEFAKQKSKEASYDYCKTIIGGYTKEEYMSFMESISKILKNIPNNNGTTKIDESMLELISGGLNSNEIGISDAWDIGKELEKFLSSVLTSIF